MLLILFCFNIFFNNLIPLKPPGTKRIAVRVLQVYGVFVAALWTETRARQSVLGRVTRSGVEKVDGVPAVGAAEGRLWQMLPVDRWIRGSEDWLAIVVEDDFACLQQLDLGAVGLLGWALHVWWMVRENADLASFD